MHEKPLVVYWSSPDNSTPYYLNIKEPVPIIEELTKHRQNIKIEGSSFFRCPSFHHALENTYSIKSPIKYDLMWEDTTMRSTQLDQEFFDKHVYIREQNIGLVSIDLFTHIFFCEEELEMAVYPAYLSDSQFANKTTLIPGKFNIGNWFRPLDLAFIINNKNEYVNINENDSLMYVKFFTDRPIILKKFYFNKTIYEIEQFCLNQKHFQYNKKIKTYLQSIYSKFKMSKLKKLLIKEIKNNLMH